MNTRTLVTGIGIPSWKGTGKKAEPRLSEQEGQPFTRPEGLGELWNLGTRQKPC